MQPYMIIGANGGIGEALAKTLKKDGLDIFVTARDGNTVSHLSDYHASVDVNDSDSLKSMIERADFGDGIKGLVYCVGSIVLKPLKAKRMKILSIRLN